MLKWPHGDQDAAVEHGAPLADQAIGDPAARQAGHVHHRRVQPVDRARDARLESQPARRDRRGHEEDEQHPHAVVAEALPHLGEEERRQPARMAEERAIVEARVRGGNSHAARKNTMIDSRDAQPPRQHVRNGPPALRDRVGRGVAARGGLGGDVRRRGEGETAARAPRIGRSDRLPSADAHRHAPGGADHRDRAAGESGGAHLRVRAVRAAERRVAAVARRRCGVRRRVRGRSGGVRWPRTIERRARRTRRARKSFLCGLRGLCVRSS